MNTKTIYLAAIAAFALGLLSPAARAESAADQLSPALLACADETDVMRRLSCFDREIATLKAKPADVPVESTLATPAAVAVIAAKTQSPPDVTSTPITTQANSSPSPATAVAADVTAVPAAVATTSAATQPEPQGSPAVPVQDARDDDFRYERLPDEFSAIVMDIRKKPHGEMLILLDNHQIWEQKITQSAFKLKVGDTATITKGLMGGYRLRNSGNRSIQVSRIK